MDAAHANMTPNIGGTREPSAELASMVFIVLTEADACFLREANQCKTEKGCRNNEEQSSAIRFYPQEPSCKHDSEKKSGTNAAAKS